MKVRVWSVTLTNLNTEKSVYVRWDKGTKSVDTVHVPADPSSEEIKFAKSQGTF